MVPGRWLRRLTTFTETTAKKANRLTKPTAEFSLLAHLAHSSEDEALDLTAITEALDADLTPEGGADE